MIWAQMVMNRFVKKLRGCFAVEKKRFKPAAAMFRFAGRHHGHPESVIHVPLHLAQTKGLAR
jgi:hypothetical protein